MALWIARQGIHINRKHNPVLFLLPVRHSFSIDMNALTGNPQHYPA
jgi:hypothetical protein